MASGKECVCVGARLPDSGSRGETAGRQRGAADLVTRERQLSTRAHSKQTEERPVMRAPSLSPAILQLSLSVPPDKLS